MKKFLLFTLFTVPLAANNILSKFYCTILGNTDAQSKYTKIIHQALNEMGINEPNKVPVKKMNCIGPLFALMPLASFTAHGIWLNESYLEQLPINNIKFDLYHEAAHYAEKHHQKLILWSTSTALFETFVLYLLHKKLQQKRCPARTITLAIGATLSPILYLKLLPYLVKKHEKEADIKATQTLLKTDQSKLLKEHLKKISEYPNKKSLWWPTPQEQISYIKKETDRFKKNT